jgi:hypothetical protein
MSSKFENLSHLAMLLKDRLSNRIALNSPRNRDTGRIAGSLADNIDISHVLTKGKSTMTDHHHEEIRNAQEAAAILEGVDKQWNTVRENPTEYLEAEKFKNTIFTAGGGLPLLYGNTESAVWQKLASVFAEKGSIEVAGVKFSQSDLELLGGFYRWLKNDKQKALSQVCIDERVDLEAYATESDLPHTHEGCGAVAGTAGAMGISAEELLTSVQMESGDQQGKIIPLRKEMVHQHTSLKIYVNTANDGRAIKIEKREELEKQKALPFHVSIPVELAREYAKGDAQVLQDLLSVLVRWNVQIAQNIISGHSELQDLSSKTGIEVDDREVNGGVPAELVTELAKVTPNIHSFSQKIS